MAKVLQKSANQFREVYVPHRGILDPHTFHAYFQLCCYEPTVELKPFVTYFWIQRPKRPESADHVTQEIFTGPNAYLFFTNDDAFIHDISHDGFDYKVPRSQGVIAGIKFASGGLYPFRRQLVGSLNDSVASARALFPQVTDDFRQKLLMQDDQNIVYALVRLLHDHLPAYDKNVELIGTILGAIETDPTMDTVDKIAKRFGKSERTLQEIFQTYVGVGLKWSLMRRRLLMAAEYARTTVRPNWLAIAHELGYSSQPHFTADFKRAVGQTPSQYVKNLRSAYAIIEIENEKQSISTL